MATALPGTGVPVSTDPITTLNGAAATASEVIQRVKLSTGAVGTATDVSAANPVPMSIASDADNIASGTLTAAAQTVVLNVATKAGAAVQLSGTWVGTVAFEGTIDGTIWTTVNAVAASTSTPQPTTTVNGLYRLTPSGLSQVRANMTVFTSGTATVSMRAGGGAGGIYANQILPTKITDGVSTATIKAASTAVAAGDSPVAVGLHPSSPLPAGANVIGAANVNTATASGVTVMQNAAVATGNGTSLTVTGYGTTVVQITGTFVASIAFETSVDAGASWFALSATQVGQGDIFNTATVPGLYRMTVTGMDLVRARVTWTSGTSITISGRSTNATNASKIVKLATSGLTIGALVANQSVNKAQINGVAPLMGNGVSGTGSQRVNIASDNTAFPVNATLSAETTKVIGAVNIAAAPAVAKGTQGANAVPTQDLKDSGRVSISLTAEFLPAAVAETMITMSVSKDGATATTASSYVITAGKRLRIASKSITVENTLGASIQRAYLRARFAITGGALTTSPLQSNCVAAAAATVKSVGTNFDDYPDGMEYLGDGTKAIGWSLQAPDWVTASATLKVYITIIAFEY